MPGRSPGEHGTQVVGIDLAVEAEAGGADAEPLAVSFAGAGVVVVERLRDTGELIRLLAHAELGDRQHTLPTATPSTNRVILCERDSGLTVRLL